MNLGPPVNTELGEDMPMIAADGSMLYFVRFLYDGSREDLFKAPIIPICDLNGNGIVDAAELYIS